MKNPHPQQLQQLQKQWLKPRGGQKVNTEIKSPFESNWTQVPQVPEWATNTCPVRLHPAEGAAWKEGISLSAQGSQLGSVRSECTHTPPVLHQHQDTPCALQAESALLGKAGMKISLFLYSNTTEQSHTFLVILSYILIQPYSFIVQLLEKAQKLININPVSE